MSTASSTDIYIALFCLLKRRSWTKRELARRLGMSTRAVKRHFRRLQDTGVRLRVDLDEREWRYWVDKDVSLCDLVAGQLRRGAGSRRAVKKAGRAALRDPQGFEDSRRSRWRYAEDHYRLPNLHTQVPAAYLAQLPWRGAATVTIYRKVAAADPHQVIRPGDWITLRRSYAEGHGVPGRVLSARVPAVDVAWAGTDMDEFIYAPPVKKGGRAVQVTDLSWLLLPPGAPLTHKLVGNETGEPVKRGLAKFKSLFGSTRYVWYVRCEAVAGLQVMSGDGGWSGVIANVWPDPSRRRKGYAGRLLKAARADYPNGIAHSAHLTGDGAGWRSAVET